MSKLPYEEVTSLIVATALVIFGLAGLWLGIAVGSLLVGSVGVIAFLWGLSMLVNSFIEFQWPIVLFYWEVAKVWLKQ